MAMTIKTLKVHSKVEFCDDERAIGNSIIIQLKQGWTFTPLDDNRIDGADNVREAYLLLKTATRHDGPYWP